MYSVHSADIIESNMLLKYELVSMSRSFLLPVSSCPSISVSHTRDSGLEIPFFVGKLFHKISRFHII